MGKHSKANDDNILDEQYINVNVITDKKEKKKIKRKIKKKRRKKGKQGREFF